MSELRLTQWAMEWLAQRHTTGKEIDPGFKFMSVSDSNAFHKPQ